MVKICRLIELWPAGLLLLLVAFALMGCAGPRGTPGEETPDDCLRVAQERLKQAPVWECLPTLDGQCVPLASILDACEALWPDCVLYAKFYHWKSEVQAIVSPSPRGPVTHQVRIYHNILHTCRPDYDDPLRTHGDVAEFYDQAGRFMGLAVYMGQGLYSPLSVPGPKTLPHTP